MEFFRIIGVKTSEEAIKNTLKIGHPEMMSSQLFLLDTMTEHLSKIGTYWGEFSLSRQDMRGGLRFSLVECPNALVWTVTTGFEPEPEQLMIHLTINRTEINREFLEEINEFLDDHAAHLQEVFD